MLSRRSSDSSSRREYGEVKIKLSQFTPRKAKENLITPKVRILIIEIIVERTYLK